MTARAENQLIAALVNGKCLEHVCHVRAADFRDPKAAEIWRAGWSLMDIGRPVTVLGLEQELRSMGTLDAVGSVVDIAGFDSNYMTEGDVKEAAEIIVRDSQRRQFGEVCRDGLEVPDSADPIAVCDDYIRRLSLISQRVEVVDAQVSDAAFERIEEIKEELRGNSPKVSTTLPPIDLHFRGGVGPGRYVVIGARPKMGKTALAIQWMLRAPEKGNPALMFSLEMNKGELVDRLFSNATSTPIGDVERNLAGYEKFAREMIGRSIQLHDDVRNLSGIIAKARQWRRQNPEGIGVICIDYIQLVDVDIPCDKSRQQELTLASRKIKLLSQELRSVILVPAQLNRKSEDREDKRPRVSDLRETGALEQDADAVFLLHRPWIYAPTVYDERRAELHLAACRFAKGHKTFLLNFDGERMRFTG